MKSLSLAERRQAGKGLREQVPREAHADWRPSADRRDPIDLLEESNRGRMPELTPIRYARMLRNPYAFLRGSAVVMAHDLAGTPATGLEVQACGDAHLANFGLFASPERNLLFDINDFDETLPAPWEWDVKRLAASFVVAGRVNGFSESACGEIVDDCTRSYREHLREFAEMSPLEVLYFRVHAQDLVENAPDPKSRKKRQQMVDKARGRVGERMLPKVTDEVNGRLQFVENPPIIVRLTDESLQRMIRQGFDDYRDTLSEDRRMVFDRYRLEDFARRVVGVGSVGTRCLAALFVCDDRSPLLLQVKEARRSVLEPFASASAFANQGQRVVVGQRKMQAASDIFLGWLRGGDGRDYYVRQLRDMKFSIPVEELDVCNVRRYAEICGWTLARSHAKTGDAASISGYLGKGDAFDGAIRQFAVAYADQTERDHQALVEACGAGRIRTSDEPP